jgi:hypothetical protein
MVLRPGSKIRAKVRSVEDEQDRIQRTCGRSG